MKRLIAIPIVSFFPMLSIPLFSFADDFLFSNGSQWGFSTSPSAIHYSLNHGHYIIQQHGNHLFVHKLNQGHHGHHFQKNHFNNPHNRRLHFFNNR
ncbi:MAG TPA: hypothetical protein VGA95_10225 [Thermodesulfobacteriota bacterium]